MRESIWRKRAHVHSLSVLPCTPRFSQPPGKPGLIAHLRNIEELVAQNTLQATLDLAIELANAAVVHPKQAV
jgi:hypothetical protein